jgi:hypothetical protein
MPFRMVLFVETSVAVGALQEGVDRFAELFFTDKKGLGLPIPKGNIKTFSAVTIETG